MATYSHVGRRSMGMCLRAGCGCSCQRKEEDVRSRGKHPGLVRSQDRETWATPHSLTSILPGGNHGV